MAETKTTKKDEAESKAEEKKRARDEAKDEEPEYVDKGHYWEIHDRRLGQDIVTTAPKTLRDVPIPPKDAKEVKERLEMEQEILTQKHEDAQKVQEAPPARDSEADDYEKVDLSKDREDKEEK